MNNKPELQSGRKGFLRAVATVTVITALVAGGVYSIKSMLFDSKPSELPPPIDLSSPFYKHLDEVPNVPQGTFRYGGSTTFAPLRSQDFVSAIKQAHPLFNIQYHEHPIKASGSGTGIEMLLAGQLSFSQSSRPIKTSEFEEAEKRDFTLEQREVAIDGIAIYSAPK